CPRWPGPPDGLKPRGKTEEQAQEQAKEQAQEQAKGHMKPTLQWGVIGTGGISTDFVAAMGRSQRCRAVNVAGSTPERARAFAERWGIAAARSVDELLADPAVEAVYIG